MSLKKCALTALAVMVLVLLGTFARAAYAEDVKLPEPRTAGGAGVFDMLKNRASALAGSYPTGSVSMEELSTILWAASGLNRPGRGWTVPMAMGREPYCKVYAVGENGAFLYDWKDNLLREVANGDVRGDIGNQSFVAKAPYILVFVIDGKAAGEWGQVAVGAMTQNVYLAAEALDIGTRYMASLKADAVREHLKLTEGDIPVCIMPIGKR